MSDHTEEEQIEAFKRWWQDNGKATVAAVVLACAGYFGYGAYQSAQEKAAQHNSRLYDKLVEAVAASGDAELSDEQRAQVTSAADAVLSSDGTSLYADLAHFQLARIAVDAGQYSDAQRELTAVLENSQTQSSIELAKLRLARVEAALGNSEEALSLLAPAPSEAFTAAYAEARGDVLAGLDRLVDAYQAYDEAMSALEEKGSSDGTRANILKFKMDNARIATSSPLAGNPSAPGSANAMNPHGLEAGQMPNTDMPNPHAPVPQPSSGNVDTEASPAEGVE